MTKSFDLPVRRIATRAEALPDLPPSTDAHSVAHAREVLGNPRLLRQMPQSAWVLGLQVGEQAMGVARTHALFQLSRAVGDNADPKTPLLTLLAAVVAPMALNAIKAPLVVSWVTRVRDGYDTAFVTASHDTPATWAMGRGTDALGGSQDVRAQRTVLYASNLRWHSDNQVQATVAMQHVALTAAANMVALGGQLGPMMGLTQAITLALTMAYGQTRFNSVTAQATAQTEANNALTGHVKRFWDNVTLGNANNLGRWSETYETLAHTADAEAKKAAWQDTTLNLKMMALAAGPILLGLVIGLGQAALAQDPVQSKRRIQELLISGPLLISAAKTLLSVSEDYWNKYSKRDFELQETLKKCLEVPKLELLAHSNLDAIEVAHGGSTMSLAQAWPSLTDAASSLQSGRYTLRAANGAGKSMAMLALKERLGAHKSYLLPADIKDLDFATAVGSTGQKDVQVTRAALKSGAQVVLLDEWDAHLDDQNRQMLNKEIDEVSAPGGRMVVEISHR